MTPDVTPDETREERDRRVGQNIRAIRLAGGSSQTEAARASGVSKSYLSHVEAGRRPLSPDVRDRLAEALDVSVAELEGGPDAGHTFQVVVRLRHSSAIVGGPHRDGPDFEEVGTVEVRAWSLSEALRRAAELPLPEWFPKEKKVGCPTPGCPGDVRYAAPGRNHIDGCTYPSNL